MAALVPHTTHQSMCVLTCVLQRAVPHTPIGAFGVVHLPICLCNALHPPSNPTTPYVHPCTPMASHRVSRACALSNVMHSFKT